MDRDQAAIKLAKNEISFNQRTHIQIKYHIGRKRISEKRTFVEYWQATYVTADILPKPLCNVPFKEFTIQMRLEIMFLFADC